MNNELLREAYNQFEDLKETLKYKNRYFCGEHAILKIINANIKSTVIKKDSILYRARIFPQDILLRRDVYSMYLKELNKPSSFNGFDAIDSMAPTHKDDIPSGRVNPPLIQYLYTARTRDTALAETKPNIGDVVSIARIKCKEDIKVADLFIYNLANDHFKDDTFEYYIKLLTALEFNKRARNYNGDYIMTQYISEYFKIKGYDAIEFSSSMHVGGSNVTIFNQELCMAISSETYELKNVKYFAQNTNNDMEWIPTPTLPKLLTK